MAGTAADAVAEMAERMLKKKDARIAELEAHLIAIRVGMQAGTPAELTREQVAEICNIALST